MKEKNPVLSETVRLLIGELIVCALVVLVYAWIEKTVRWQVILSALIGAAVIVLNFFLLARSTDNLFLTASPFVAGQGRSFPLCFFRGLSAFRTAAKAKDNQSPKAPSDEGAVTER